MDDPSKIVRNEKGQFVKGANLGNQWAKGCKVRSPRDVAPEDDELIELGKEMVEWVAQNKPLHLNWWYTLQKFITYEEFKMWTLKPVFLPYLQIAKSIISEHYLDKNSNLDNHMRKFLGRHYFPDGKEEEDAKTVHDANARAQAESQHEKTTIVKTISYSDHLQEEKPVD
jgi:hypothetical protein